MNNGGSGRVRIKLWFVVLLAVGSLIYLFQCLQWLPPAASLHEPAQLPAEALVQQQKQQQQQQQQNCNYHISSHSTDGIGHQMEAKLSCLAAAAALNWTYVHRPVEKLQHGQNPAHMEALFGLSAVSVPALAARRLHALPYNRTAMRFKRRDPQPRTGRCDQENWFDQQQQQQQRRQRMQRDDATKTTNCLKEGDGKIGVYSNDNCWDYFWCHTQDLPAVWKTDMVPTLRSALLQSLAVHIPGHRQTLRVALHMRMGDSGRRRASVDWCQHVLRQLIRAAAAQRQEHGIQSMELTIHSDASHRTVEQSLRLDATEFLRVTILSVDDPEGTIERAMYDMVTAHILVASDSSLSHAAAFLRDERGVVLHPDTNARSRMVHLGWHMLRLRTRVFRLFGPRRLLQRCVNAPPAHVSAGCRRWAGTDEAFWNQLVVQAFTAVEEAAGGG